MCIKYTYTLNIYQLSITLNIKCFSSIHSKDRKKCYNSSDCIGGNKHFCNHDYDVFGYCEECKMLTSINCAEQEFLCELGEKSCNESCPQSNEGNRET